MVKKAIVSIVLVLSVVLFSNCSYAEEKGLVGYWNFDESKGEIAKDFSGKGNDGTIYGAVATAGKIGQALSFDGDNDYVDLSTNVANFSGLTQGSISVWFKNENTGDFRSLLALSDKGDASSEFTVWKNITDFLALEIREEGGGEKITSTVTIGIGIWYHVVITVDAGGTKLYLNGALDNSNGNMQFISHVNDIDFMAIGANQDSSGFQWQWDGTIDEVRIYNRVLTATEVENLYKRGSDSIDI